MREVLLASWASGCCEGNQHEHVYRQPGGIWHHKLINGRVVVDARVISYGHNHVIECMDAQDSRHGGDGEQFPAGRDWPAMDCVTNSGVPTATPVRMITFP